MARSPEILEDPTPLDGTHVDVRVRIAWLLRSWRTHGRDGEPISVTDMARLLKKHGSPASAPSVSGWETGRVAPSPVVVEAYEAVLGLDPGCLRSVVDLVRRRFGDERPRSTAPAPRLPDLDAAVDRVAGAVEPAGLAWLHLCEAVLAVRPGLPTAFLRPLVSKLLSEMARCHFTAYTTRYEALALLRCSQYGDLVADAVSDYLAEPGNLMLGDASALLCERPDTRALAILSSQLDSDEFLRLRGGVVGIGLMAATGGPEPSGWRLVVDPFVQAWERHVGDPGRRRELAGLWELLPAHVQHELNQHLDGQIDADRRPRPSEPSSRAGQLYFCARAADRVTDALGLPSQPLLARLLFEALFDARYARRFTSALLLMASPFRGPLASELATTAGEHQDAEVRRAAAMVLLAIGREESHPQATALLDSEDAMVVSAALYSLMYSGARLSAGRVEALLRRADPIDRRAVIYAGMTDHPVLARIASDPDHPLRTEALWWQRHGPRVVD